MKTKFFLWMLLLLGAGSTLAQPRKYAVIITGDQPGDDYDGQYAVPNSNYDEFWNDTYLMWEMLVTKFGFHNDDVFVLYGDSNDYVPEASRYKAFNNTGYPKITDLSATFSNVGQVLQGLKDGTNGYPQFTQDDFLFVFTFGHGHIDGIGDPPPYHGALELMGSDEISDTYLAYLVNGINANKRVVWMQNCGSGDFSDEFLIDNTVVLNGLLYDDVNPERFSENKNTRPTTRLNWETLAAEFIKQLSY